MTYEEKVQALVDELGYTYEEARYFLEDMGDND